MFSGSRNTIKTEIFKKKPADPISELSLKSTRTIDVLSARHSANVIAPEILYGASHNTYFICFYKYSTLSLFETHIGR